MPLSLGLKNVHVGDCRHDLRARIVLQLDRFSLRLVMHPQALSGVRILQSRQVPRLLAWRRSGLKLRAEDLLGLEQPDGGPVVKLVLLLRRSLPGLLGTLLIHCK